MTEKKTKKAATKKPTSKRVINPQRVAVLETHVGERLIIRANPTKVAVRNFVKEQNRRWEAREPAGPQGLPPYRVHAAHYYPSELEIDEPEKAVKIPLTNL